MEPRDARGYDRSLEMGNATSDGVAGRCISAQEGDGDRVSLRRQLECWCLVAAWPNLRVTGTIREGPNHKGTTAGLFV